MVSPPTSAKQETISPSASHLKLRSSTSEGSSPRSPPMRTGIVPASDARRTSELQHEPECKSMAKKKVVFVTIEFVDPIFSGNGVYSRSIVSAMASKGWEVLVISGTDAGKAIQQSSWQSPLPLNIAKNVSIKTIPLQVWNRLDRLSDWEKFSEMGTSEETMNAIVNFQPDLFASVDWTGGVCVKGIMEAYEKIRKYPKMDNRTRLIAFIFRVFCSKYTTEFSDQDKQFYKEKEKDLIRFAQMIISCSSIDSSMVRELILDDGGQQVTKCKYLNPPLRDNFLEELKLLKEPQNSTEAPNEGWESKDSQNEGRSLLLCCCRLSIEKRVHFFADVVTSEPLLSYVKENKYTLNRETNMPRTLKICLVGAVGGDAEYVAKIKNRLRNHYGEEHLEIVDTFLGPKEMIQILNKTLLNFHPCLYDSYAMTVAEAASCGAPSIVHRAGNKVPQIGAEDLLSTEKPLPGVYSYDMAEGNTSPIQNAIRISNKDLLSSGKKDYWETVESTGRYIIQEILEQPQSWETLRNRARERSLIWDSERFADRLVEMLS